MAIITYSAALLRLDEKRKHLHTPADLAALDAKPIEQWTADDLDLHAGFHSPEIARAKREEHAKAVTEREAAIIRKEIAIAPTTKTIAEEETESRRASMNLAAYADVLVMTIQGALVPVLERIATLEADNASLQATIGTLEKTIANRVLLADGGIWKAGASYQRGDCVTHRGSSWVCKRDHTGTEAFDHACWRLQAKSAQLNRDAVAAVMGALTQRETE
jgi:hypothetical protein